MYPRTPVSCTCPRKRLRTHATTKIKGLRILYLTRSGDTDVGLVQLERVLSLERLYVCGIGVFISKAAIARLEAVLPSCHVQMFA